MKILVAGAGGFIGGHLVKRLEREGHGVRGVDRKAPHEWYQKGRANRVMDLTDPICCSWACQGIDIVYNLAADMGGMGFIEKHRVDCLRSVLINTNLIEAAYQAKVKQYFFASSACVYNTRLQQTEAVQALKETDAYPAMAERGYGWEKLFSEMVCQEYWKERTLPTHIARFHNVYGPNGTWDGGREKAPAAICRKVIEAIDQGKNTIEIWGDGKQTRSFMWIDDCIEGIMRIVNSPTLIAEPINLGSSELISINALLSLAEDIAGLGFGRTYDLYAPKGVAGRNSDNTFIQSVLGWQPRTPIRKGLELLYHWIEEQYQIKKEGGRVIQ